MSLESFDFLWYNFESFIYLGHTFGQSTILPQKVEELECEGACKVLKTEKFFLEIPISQQLKNNDFHLSTKLCAMKIISFGGK